MRPTLVAIIALSSYVLGAKFKSDPYILNLCTDVVVIEDLSGCRYTLRPGCRLASSGTFIVTFKGNSQVITFDRKCKLRDCEGGFSIDEGLF